MNSMNRHKRILIMIMFGSGALLLFFWAHTEIGISHTEGSVIKGTRINVKNKLCYVTHNDTRSYVTNKTDLRMIYFVTPTYPRPEQIPELTRLGHTLMHVPRIHWIVADDQNVCSGEVLNILRQTGLPFTHISSPKPYLYKVPNFPRGVSNRRAALVWLRENVDDGVIYFGDDDNTYDLQLFNEIRTTKRVGMFPVGLIGKYGVSSPVVNNGKVEAFFDFWPGDRTFPIDMAGFAINIQFLKPSASMPYIEGLEEDKFLTSTGLKLEDIEPLAENCSKVYVWHTKTSKFKKANLKVNIGKLQNISKYENFANLLKEAVKLGLTNILADNGIKTVILKNGKSFDVNELR